MGYKIPCKKNEIISAPNILTDDITPIESAIAAGILLSSHQVNFDTSWVIIGGIDERGDVGLVQGLYEMIEKGKEEGFSKFIVPYSNYEETTHIRGCDFRFIKRLTDTFKETKYEFTVKAEEKKEVLLCNETIRRAFEIAAAGYHDVAIYGDKCDLIAPCIIDFLPPLADAEKRKVILNFSNYDVVKAEVKRPFRVVDNSMNEEIIKREEKLSEHGVLYIRSTVRRYAFDGDMEVIKVIANPPYDNLTAEIHVPVHELEVYTKTNNEKILNAAEIQEKRYVQYRHKRNKYLSRHGFARYCKMSKEASGFLKNAVDKFKMTASEQEKVIRVARTVSDLGGRELIDIYDISEAVGFVCYKKSRGG